MNLLCKSMFGIIQANEKHPYINNWKQLFEKNNYTVDNIINLNTITKTKSAIKKNSFNYFLSKLFTLKGYLLSIVNRIFIKQNFNFKKSMKIDSNKGDFLIGYILILTKN